MDQAQFHSLPPTSFLRLNAPESFGDDLSKFRPIVVAVNRDQTPRKGFAIARSGPAVVGVVPMFDLQEKHIGSFEFGIAFDDLLDNLKNAYSLEMAVFIDEASLHEFAKGVTPAFTAIKIASVDPSAFIRPAPPSFSRWFQTKMPFRPLALTASALPPVVRMWLQPSVV